MRQTLLLIFLLSFTCKAQMFYSPRDKNLHYLAGLTIGLFGGEIAYQIKDNTFFSLGSAIGLGSLAGYSKEVYDRDYKKTRFDNSDLMTTCWGSFNAAIVMRVRIDIGRKRKEKQLKEYFKNDTLK